MEALGLLRFPEVHGSADPGDVGERPDLGKLYIPERKNIEVRWVENASHPLLLEAPEEVAGLVNEFVSRIGGRGRV
jgi:hypothetical protein